MRQFIDVTGKTEDEAISRALEQLGLDRDDVSVEILERAKAGFLGLGSCPAKVRVSYGPEEESASQQPKAEKVREERVEKPRAPRPEKKTVEKPAEKPQHREEPKQEPVQSVKTEELGEEVNDDRAQEIKKFLSGLLQQLEVQAEIKVYLPEKGRYKVFLEGQGLGHRPAGRDAGCHPAAHQLFRQPYRQPGPYPAGCGKLPCQAGAEPGAPCKQGGWKGSQVPPQRHAGAYERL